jgi:hypothetical protein
MDKTRATTMNMAPGQTSPTRPETTHIQPPAPTPASNTHHLPSTISASPPQKLIVVDVVNPQLMHRVSSGGACVKPTQCSCLAQKVPGLPLFEQRFYHVAPLMVLLSTSPSTPLSILQRLLHQQSNSLERIEILFVENPHLSHGEPQRRQVR